MQLCTYSYLLFGDAVRHPLVLMSCAVLCASILISVKRIWQLFGAAACILISSAAVAGAISAFKAESIFLPAALSLTLILFLLRRRMNIRYRWNIEVKVQARGKTIYFEALIDTGNRLREPVSGLPVLIASDKLVPNSFFDGYPCRKLAFGVLGSSGEIYAYLPDNVMIRSLCSDFVSAPECYIAVFPGRFPGSTQALAPPEFTEVQPSPAPTFRRRICRRNNHAVFKHPSVNLWSRGSNQERFGLLHRRQ